MRFKDLDLLIKSTWLSIAIFTGVVGYYVFSYGVPTINSSVIFNFGLVFSGLCYGTIFFIWKKIDKLSKEYSVEDYGKIVHFKNEDLDFEGSEELKELIRSSIKENIEIGPKFLKIIVLPFFLASLGGIMFVLFYAETLSQSSVIGMMIIIIMFYILGWIMYVIGLKYFNLLPA